MSQDERDRDEKTIEKVTGAEKVGEAVEEELEEGPSREHAEKNPPESQPGGQGGSAPAERDGD